MQIENQKLLVKKCEPIEKLTTALVYALKTFQ